MVTVSVGFWQKMSKFGFMELKKLLVENVKVRFIIIGSTGAAWAQ